VVYIGATIGIYAFIGIMSRTAQVSNTTSRAGPCPAVYNGMATGADWMSGASFVGMAGTLFVLGYDGLAFVLGWTGGYVLVAVLLAPYLRKFGAYTVPDFLGTRYGGNAARLVGIIVLFACSFTYITAQVYASGIIASQFLGIDFELRGVRGSRRHPRLLDARRHEGGDLDAGGAVHRADRRLPAPGDLDVDREDGVPIPQLTYGGALSQIAAVRADPRVAKAHIVVPFTRPTRRWTTSS
jgi:cation/acetate symporter